jgi:hypothetical protein
MPPSRPKKPSNKQTPHRQKLILTPLFNPKLTNSQQLLISKLPSPRQQNWKQIKLLLPWTPGMMQLFSRQHKMRQLSRRSKKLPSSPQSRLQRSRQSKKLPHSPLQKHLPKAPATVKAMVEAMVKAMVRATATVKLLLRRRKRRLHLES